MLKRAGPLLALVFVAFLTISSTLIISTTITLNLDTSVLPKGISFSNRLLIYGAFMGALPLGQFFGAPIIGGLSDRLGRKRILLIMLFCISICYVIVGMSLEMHRLLYFGIFMFVAGLFEGCVVLAQSVISDLTDGKQRAEGLGLIVAMKSSGYVFGPSLATILSDHHIVSWFRFSTPYFAFSIAFIAIFFWILFGFTETLPQEKRHQLPILQNLTNMRYIITNRKLRPLYLLNFLFYFGLYGFYRLYPAYIMNTYHLDQADLGFIFTYFAALQIGVTTSILKFFSSRYSPYRLYQYSSMGLAIFILSILLIRPYPFQWILLAIGSVAVGISMAISQAIISINSDQATQGRALGNNLSIQFITQIISSFAGSILAIYWIGLPLLVTALCALIASIISFIIWRKREEAKKSSLDG